MSKDVKGGSPSGKPNYGLNRSTAFVQTKPSGFSDGSDVFDSYERSMDDILTPAEESKSLMQLGTHPETVAEMRETQRSLDQIRETLKVRDRAAYLDEQAHFNRRINFLEMDPNIHLSENDADLLRKSLLHEFNGGLDSERGSFLQGTRFHSPTVGLLKKSRADRKNSQIFHNSGENSSLLQKTIFKRGFLDKGIFQKRVFDKGRPIKAQLKARQAHEMDVFETSTTDVEDDPDTVSIRFVGSALQIDL